MDIADETHQQGVDWGRVELTGECGVLGRGLWAILQESRITPRCVGGLCVSPDGRRLNHPAPPRSLCGKTGIYLLVGFILLCCIFERLETPSASSASAPAPALPPPREVATPLALHVAVAESL